MKTPANSSNGTTQPWDSQLPPCGARPSALGTSKGCQAITTTCVYLFIKVVDETEIGYMDQRRAGIRSTRVQPDTESDPDSMELVPQTLLNDHTNHVELRQQRRCHILLRGWQLHQVISYQVKAQIQLTEGIQRCVCLPPHQRVQTPAP